MNYIKKQEELTKIFLVLYAYLSKLESHDRDAKNLIDDITSGITQRRSVMSILLSQYNLYRLHTAIYKKSKTDDNKIKKDETRKSIIEYSNKINHLNQKIKDNITLLELYYENDNHLKNIYTKVLTRLPYQKVITPDDIELSELNDEITESIQHNFEIGEMLARPIIPESRSGSRQQNTQSTFRSRQQTTHQKNKTHQSPSRTRTPGSRTQEAKKEEQKGCVGCSIQGGKSKPKSPKKKTQNKKPRIKKQTSPKKH